MNASRPIATERRSMKGRKIAAILAGGLVLGTGAAVTLASWNDSEVATGNFAAGTFVFQGSADGATFTDHSSVAGSASLAFSAGFDRLTPNDVVYAPYALRLTGNTPATLTAQLPNITGTINGKLDFGTVQTPTFGCNAASFAAGLPLTTTITPGQTVYVCIRVSASDTLVQGDAGQVNWQWNVVSS